MNPETSLRGPERFTLQADVPAPPSMSQALLAGAALLALVVGVPTALWLLTGPPPLPTGLPTRTQLSEALAIEDLFAVLRAVVWLAWLQFVVCTLVELTNYVDDRGLPHPVPLSGRSQALARALLGTFLVGTSVLGSTGASFAAAPDPATSISQGITAIDRASEEGDFSGALSDVSGSDVTEAGSRMNHVPGVPSDMTDVIGHKVAIVQPPNGAYHDNLWDIAERTMGDGRRWKEIFELNKNRTQPDGQQLVLGRLIQPGWVLVMPEDARNVTRVTAAVTVPAKNPPVSSAQESTADQAYAGSVSDITLSNAVSGGLLAAVLVGALLAERRRRRGVAPSADEAEVEVALRVTADEDRARRLDQALRGLAALCHAEQIPLPQIYAVTAGDQGIDLHLAPPVDTAPAPWNAHDDGARWHLDVDAEVSAVDAPAPYPALVCLGRDDDGRDVLLDLEALGGVVSLSGSDAVAREVASAMAVQLAFSPWSDDQTVHGHRLAPETSQIGGPGLQVVHDLDALLREWSSGRRRRPANDVLSGRVQRADGEAARFLVLGEAPTSEGSHELLTELMSESDRGTALVSAVPLPGARWTLEVDQSGRLRVPLLDVEVDAVRLVAGTAADTAALFAKARVAAPVLAGDRVAVPRPPMDGDDAHWSAAPVRVGVLGALDVRASGQMDAARLQLATEVVVFLALQQTPVHPSVVGASIWPGGVTAEVRDATLARVRDWLGTGPDGSHLLQENEEGRLLLSADVAVDWHAFCTLTLRARSAAPLEEAELLRRALHLVRGEFLTGRPSRRYSWLPRTRVERQSTDLVVDTVHRLVELSLPQDPGGAVTACRAGLRLAPTSQVLWRDLVLSEAQHTGGSGVSAVSAVAAQMHRELAAAGVPVEAETEALVEEFLPGFGTNRKVSA